MVKTSLSKNPRFRQKSDFLRKLFQKPTFFFQSTKIDFLKIKIKEQHLRKFWQKILLFSDKHYPGPEGTDFFLRNYSSRTFWPKIWVKVFLTSEEVIASEIEKWIFLRYPDENREGLEEIFWTYPTLKNIVAKTRVIWKKIQGPPDRTSVFLNCFHGSSDQNLSDIFKTIFPKTFGQKIRFYITKLLQGPHNQK